MVHAELMCLKLFLVRTTLVSTEVTTLPIELQIQSEDLMNFSINLSSVLILVFGFNGLINEGQPD